MAVSSPAPDAVSTPTKQDLPQTPAQPERVGSSALAALGRLTWMLLGPMALLLATLSLFTRGRSTFGTADGAFFAALGAMLLGRWLDFRGGTPLTADGEPATAAHLRRFVLWTTVAGAAIWAAAAAAAQMGWAG
jgi:hypothetical protein